MKGLTSMKLTPKERKEMTDPKPSDGPIYPWGLQVRLDNDALEALKFSKLPVVGKSMLLVAKVDVTGAAELSRAEDGKQATSRSLELQITDMQLTPEGKDVTATLYGEGEE